MGFDISSIEFNWEKLAQDDPLWAILTIEEKKGGQWDIDEFMSSGVRNISLIADRCSELGLSFSGTKALDFGCGVGRLSSAMLEFVNEVVGVDIADSMIKIGKKLHKGKPIKFILNKKDELSCFPDNEFDLILTLITLQHMPPEIEEKYIIEFLRILKPGGLLVFQLPGRSFTPEHMLVPKTPIKKMITKMLPGHFYERLKHLRGAGPRIDMFGMPPENVQDLISNNDANLVACDELEAVEEGYPNYFYFVTKN